MSVDPHVPSPCMASAPSSCQPSSPAMGFSETSGHSGVAEIPFQGYSALGADGKGCFACAGCSVHWQDREEGACVQRGAALPFAKIKSPCSVYRAHLLAHPVRRALLWPSLLQLLSHRQFNDFIIAAPRGGRETAYSPFADGPARPQEIKAFRELVATAGNRTSISLTVAHYLHHKTILPV